MQKILNGKERKVIFNICCVIGVILFHHSGLFSQNNDKNPHKIHTVVIDAGHGGKDPGAIGKNSKEKDIVLSICLQAGKYIEEKMPEVKVVYTRTTDVFIPLHERAKIANEAKADLFISIHANSNPNTKAYGTETFAMGLHKSQDNLEVAKKENSVIVFEDDYKTHYENFDPNDIESYIMISLIQDTYLKQSLTAASFVQNQFRERVKLKDRGVKQAGFLVLWQTSMPSILVETGFLSNNKDEEFLLSKSGQDYLASAIYRAFKDYKQGIESGSTYLTNYNTSSTTNLEVIAKSDSSENNKQIKTDTVLNDKSVEESTSKINSAPAVVQTKNTDKVSISDSVTFRVQILYSANKVSLSDETFTDFNDIQEINYNGKYKYVVGSKSTYREAIEYSKWVKNRYPDAFIVAVSNGKIIPLSQAIKEK